MELNSSLVIRWLAAGDAGRHLDGGKIAEAWEIADVGSLGDHP